MVRLVAQRQELCTGGNRVSLVFWIQAMVEHPSPLFYPMGLITTGVLIDCGGTLSRVIVMATGSD